MKIYLVTMKSLDEGSVGLRMRYIASEAAGEEPDSNRTWLKPEDDQRHIDSWRAKTKARVDLLNDLGIKVQLIRQHGENATEYALLEQFMTPTFPCTGDQLLSILEVDDSITVKASAPIAQDSPEGALARLIHVIEKLENLNIPDPVAAQGHIYNEHVEVHTPGNMLATYNETLLLEDSCTDDLQKALDAGWRIVAACPQAQRRPDYILGRWNPDIEAGNGAQRKP